MDVAPNVNYGTGAQTLGRLEAEGAFTVPDDTPNYNLRFTLDDFEFGLQRLLDGIEAHVATARNG